MAQSNPNSFTGNLGLGFGIGQLGSDDINFDNRLLTHMSADGLVGYQFSKKLLMGVDLNYGVHQQLPNESEVAGTNLSGQMWLAGLGLSYRFTPRWAIQTSVHGAGSYALKKNAVPGFESALESPLSVKVKALFFNRPHSVFSADVAAQYVRWGNFNTSGALASAKAQQWILLLGVTYHFGAAKAEPEAFEEEENVEYLSQQNQIKEMSEVVKTEKTEKGFKIELNASGFLPNKSNLNDELKSKLKNIADILKKNPKQKIKVTGHTDSTGRVETNKALSMARAEAVRQELYNQGVAVDQVSAQGLGSDFPIADNASKEGREKNRRIEIEVERMD